MHLLETLVSGFQPIDDFSFNLSKLQVLNLENTKMTPTVHSHCDACLLTWFIDDAPVTHQLLQVADLVVSLVQQLVLVALLLQQQQSFSVNGTKPVTPLNLCAP